MSDNYVWREIYNINTVFFPGIYHEIQINKKTNLKLHTGPLHVNEPTFPSLQATDGILRGVGLVTHEFPSSNYLVIDINDVKAEEKFEEGHEIALEVAACLSIKFGDNLFEKCIYKGWAGNKVLSRIATLANPISFANPEKELAVPNDIFKNKNENMLLALRWYMKAIQTPEPIDAFLSHWISLEVFPMRGTRKIDVLVKYISTILDNNYQEKEVKECLNIGRLYGLRGEIVHHGNYKKPIKNIYSWLLRLRELNKLILGNELSIIEKNTCRKMIMEMFVNGHADLV